MFGSAKKNESDVPVLLAREGQFVAGLNKQAYAWLGERYAYYDKIRHAGEGFNLFGEKDIAELMAATRSALSLTTKTVNGGIAIAYNKTVDEVANSGTAPEGWPAKLDVPDRSNAPAVSPREDALLLAWMPLRFLNLAKPVRDKGKGLDLYTDGLVKKFYFKVIGYYADPAHWDPERLGYMLAGLEPDAPVLDVNNKLSGLKSELEQLASSYQLFRFGRPPRGAAGTGDRNTIEDAFEISQAELVQDLYLQHYLITGVELFLFRYYATLLEATDNPRAMRALSNLFEPALAKAAEIRLQFQASFMMESQKSRLRGEFQAFGKALEARPTVEQVEVKGKPTRRVNYSLKLLELTALHRSARLSERQAHNWAAYWRPAAIERADPAAARALVLEMLATMVRATKLENEGRAKVAETLRQFGEDQEKQGLRQVAQKKKAVAEAKRKKMAQSRKFKILEQKEMAQTVQEEAEAEEQKGLQEIEQLQEGLTKRRIAFTNRAAHMVDSAHPGGSDASARAAAATFRVAAALDPEARFQNEFVSYLLTDIREGNDAFPHDLYRQLFTVLPNLYPTQKIMLRKALESKIDLGSDEMQVSEEELASYREQIENRKREIEGEVPGLMDMRLYQGNLRASVDQLLETGIANPSLRLLFQLPFNAPNKPPGKLPGAAVQKLLALNSLVNPFPEVDLILPNVQETAPPAKRLNLNRLSKALDEAKAKAS